MTLPLRLRRRQETTLQIQRATLELAMQNGLESITTEEIAAEAGVSTRTFFNYYANKEAAAIGHPPGFDEKDKDALRKGTAPLAADLKRVLDGHMDRLAQDLAILRMVGKILRSNEKARGILDGFLLAERGELTDILCHRVRDRNTAAALAGTAANAMGAAIFLWGREDDITLGAASDMTWKALMDASRLLVSSTDA